MGIAHVVTRGYGTGSFDGTIPFVTTRGYTIGPEVIVVDLPGGGTKKRRKRAKEVERKLLAPKTVPTPRDEKLEEYRARSEERRVSEEATRRARVEKQEALEALARQQEAEEKATLALKAHAAALAAKAEVEAQAAKREAAAKMIEGLARKHRDEEDIAAILLLDD